MLLGLLPTAATVDHDYFLLLSPVEGPVWFSISKSGWHMIIRNNIQTSSQ